MTVAIDWNAYRRDYATLTDKQHKELYERVWLLHREQKSATVGLVKKFLEEFGPGAVVEIGSWDGWLREQTAYPNRWFMIELCESAARAISLEAGEASWLCPPEFRWWTTFEPQADMLIACHMIEHLSDDDFVDMARTVFPNFRAVYLEAPLPQQGPCNWHNYAGSHVMTMGWDGVRKLMWDMHFAEQWAEKDSVVWRKL